MNGKQVISKLKAAGWMLKRVNGSHHVMDNGTQAFTVPVHGSCDLASGTLASIARQSGVQLK
jgi:predicted RNA binding protein YcfA (HicA-like mRNA interferase family)